MILTILIRSQISNPSVSAPWPAAVPGIKPNNNQLILNMSLLRGRTSGHGHRDKNSITNFAYYAGLHRVGL